MPDQNNSDQILFKIGRKISELRNKKGLTQEKFAEQTRVSLKYIQRIEAGRENLTIQSLCRIADFFKVDLKRLFASPRSKKVTKGRPSKK